MLRKALIITAILALAGCSSVKTTIIERHADGSITKTKADGACNPVETQIGYMWKAVPVHYKLPSGEVQSVLRISDLATPLPIMATKDYCTDPLRPAAGTSEHKILYRENGRIQEIDTKTDDKTIETLGNELESILTKLDELSGERDMPPGVTEVGQEAQFLVIYYFGAPGFYRQDLTLEGLPPFPGSFNG